MCWANRRFGACVKRPAANRSSSYAKPKPCSAKSSPLSRCPRHARRNAKATGTAKGMAACTSATHRRFEQFLAATLQVSHALLMSGLSEMVVHTPTVMHQRARPVEPQQLFRRLPTAGRVNHVTRFTTAHKGVQPSRAAANTPACLVRRDLRRAAHIDSQLFIGWRTTLGRAQCRTDAGGSGQVQFREECSQQFHALAVRQAQLFVENREQGMHPRPSFRLAARHRPHWFVRGVGPDAALQLPYISDMHVEPAINHRAWNLGLVLHGQVRFAYLPTRAVRAGVRQRHVVGLVDPRWNATMRVRTMALARLATRWLWLRNRRPFRERRRLSFVVRVVTLFQRRRELATWLRKACNSLPQLGTVGTIFSRSRASMTAEITTIPQKGVSSSR